MTKIKTCLFDLGNVLAFFSHDRMCEQLAALYHVTAHDMKRLIMSKDIADPWERGHLNRHDIFKLLTEHFQQSVPSEKIELALAEIFTPNHDILPVIRQLNKQEIRLVLLSNTCDIHFEFLEQQLPHLQYFDEFILSYKVGFRKPEQEIFQAASKVINCDPAECFYADDIDLYVQTARSLGFQGITFTNTASYISTLTNAGLQLD